MHATHFHCDALIPHATPLLSPCAAAHGGASSTSSRVFLLGAAAKPFRCRGVRAAGAGAAVDDGFVKDFSREMTFYELLGVPEDGTLMEIKQAYKKLARKYHPDVSPPGRLEEHTRRFISVQEAYETLSDPLKRAFYDMDLAEGFNNLAFSSRNMGPFDEESEYKRRWKNLWQTQLSELQRRSQYKASAENMSWGAQMRRQWNESSAED